MSKTFHVYLLASQSGVLYTGVTNNLSRRVHEHRQGVRPGFTRTYNIHKLVWFEGHGSGRSAIDREKQIKGWLRAKKIALIEAANPTWSDLSAELGNGNTL